MFCNNCGMAIKDSHEFCMGCGRKVERDEMTTQESPVESKKSKNKFLTPVIIVAVIVLGGVGTFFGIQAHNNRIEQELIAEEQRLAEEAEQARLAEEQRLEEERLAEEARLISEGFIKWDVADNIDDFYTLLSNKLMDYGDYFVILGDAIEQIYADVSAGLDIMDNEMYAEFRHNILVWSYGVNTYPRESVFSDAQTMFNHFVQMATLSEGFVSSMDTAPAEDLEELINVFTTNVSGIFTNINNLAIALGNISAATYLDYPTIPDFGAFSGATLIERYVHENGITYFYALDFDPDIIVDYTILLLEEFSFLYDEALSATLDNTLVVYRDNYALLIGMIDGDFAVVVVDNFGE